MSLSASIGEFLARDGSWRILADLVLLGAFGGFYSVPLYALIQKRSKRQHLSRIIAANNIINSVLMVGAAILSIVVLRSGFSIPELFVIIAVLNVVVAIYIYSLLPEFLMRFLAWLMITVVYRVRPVGLDNIPPRARPSSFATTSASWTRLFSAVAFAVRCDSSCGTRFSRCHC